MAQEASVAIERDAISGTGENQRVTPHRPASRALARKACDACRVRKAKCDTISSAALGHQRDSIVESAPPCQRCAKLDIPCTFLLPSGVRGPRRKRKSLNASNTLSSTSSRPRENRPSTGFSQDATNVSTETRWSVESPPSFRSHPSIINNGNLGLPASNPPWPTSPHSTANSLSSLEPSFPTDCLCSRQLLHCIMGDYLDFLYPLIPVVHRPSFRHDLSRNRDVYDKNFLALIVSICTVTVGTMPSRFREYCSAETPIRFQSRMEMINYCYNMIMGLRGHDYFDEINFQKWATSYLVGISFFQIGELNRARMCDVESMQLARLLELHSISGYDGLNCIETQLRKKAFWLMFYYYIHGQLQNLRKERLNYLDESILDSINFEELMPLEVDDEVILEHEVLFQPAKQISITTGFVVHSRLFWTALRPTVSPNSPNTRLEHCNCVRSRDPALQLAHLKSRLHDLKYMLDSIPAQLRQWSPTDVEDSGFEALDSDQRRIVQGQFASMRANIHITHLWLQSIISDQVDILLSNDPHLESPGSPITLQDARTRWAEREDICRQLLYLLHAIPQAYIEPNGHHLTNKVRDVAVTLLACPFDPDDDVARRAQEYLREFANKLSKLDGSEIINTSSLQSWVDTGRQY